MAYPGIACVLIGVTLATLLYYMFGNNEQQSTHSGSRYRPTNDYYENNYSSYSDSDYHDTIRGSSVSNEYDDCTICLSSLTTGRKVTLKTCSHVFHRKCIEQWKLRSDKKSCPNCRCPFE